MKRWNLLFPKTNLLVLFLRLTPRPSAFKTFCLSPLSAQFFICPFISLLSRFFPVLHPGHIPISLLIPSSVPLFIWNVLVPSGLQNSLKFRQVSTSVLVKVFFWESWSLIKLVKAKISCSLRLSRGVWMEIYGGTDKYILPFTFMWYTEDWAKNGWKWGSEFAWIGIRQ